MNPSDDPLAAVKFADTLPPRELGRRIVADCTKGLGPARGMSRAARLSITLLTAAVTCAALFKFEFDQVVSSPESLAATLSWAGGLVVFSVFVLLKPPGHRSANARRALIVLLLLGFLGFLASLVDKAAPFTAALVESSTYDCALYSIVTGAMTVLLIMLPWRRTDPLSPNLTAAFLGLCGGVTAGLAASLVCPNHEAWHLYLGHGLALALTVAAAAHLGKRWLCP